MLEENPSVKHDEPGEDCMGKAIKYGALGVYSKWCAIIGAIILCVTFLAGVAVLPISYINTTFRKSYVSRGSWFMNVSLHALKTTTIFGEC